MKPEQSQSTTKEWFPINGAIGFSLVEVILATSIFGLLVVALVGAYLYGQEAASLAGNRARANMLAEEGLEAVRNIRDSDFSNLLDGTHGLVTTGNQWGLFGSSDTTDIFTREISISTVDVDRKALSCTVSWQQNPQRTGSVTIVSRMTNWQSSAPVASTCNDYAVQEGYSMGICRQNIQQCANRSEDYLPDGDVFCTGGPSQDTCCALP